MNKTNIVCGITVFILCVWNYDVLRQVQIQKQLSGHYGQEDSLDGGSSIVTDVVHQQQQVLRGTVNKNNNNNMMSSHASQKTTKLPCVQLIGAQKSGTSSIARWLFEGGFRRPRVIGTEPRYYSKEVHFFDIDDRFNRGLDFYAERFRDENLDTMPTMDATPNTFQYAERVRSIYDEAGIDQANNLKILVILREPVTRELSLYNHLVHDYKMLKESERESWHSEVINTNGSIMSFDEFVEVVSLPALRNNDGIGLSTRHGLYAKHLKKWFEVFDRKQILVLSFNELQKDPRKLQDRIESFLGRHISGKLQRANDNDHSSKLAAPSDAASSALQSVFANHNNKLYELLEMHPGPPMEEKPFPKFEENH